MDRHQCVLMRRPTVGMTMVELMWTLAIFTFFSVLYLQLMLRESQVASEEIKENDRQSSIRMLMDAVRTELQEANPIRMDPNIGNALWIRYQKPLANNGFALNPIYSPSVFTLRFVADDGTVADPATVAVSEGIGNHDLNGNENTTDSVLCKVFNEGTLGDLDKDTRQNDLFIVGRLQVEEATAGGPIIRILPGKCTVNLRKGLFSWLESFTDIPDVAGVRDGIYNIAQPEPFALLPPLDDRNGNLVWDPVLVIHIIQMDTDDLYNKNIGYGGVDLRRVDRVKQLESRLFLRNY